jgi:FMN phosphatase YigB (HAD superfamily)
MKDQCHLVIFDLDDTLHKRDQEDLSLHIRDILEYLRSLGIKLALASLNIFAKEYLQKYRILHLFDCVEYRQGNRKTTYTKQHMFKRIKSKTNISFNNMIVFDDNFYHCIEAKSLGIKYCCVTSDLLKWTDVKEGLRMFKSRSRSKSCHL